MAVAVALYREARGATRLAAGLMATVRNGSDPADAMVKDLSITGFSIDAAESLLIGEAISIGLSGIGVRDARVRWRSFGSYGCEFIRPLSSPELAKAIGGASTMARMPTAAAGPMTIVEEAQAAAKANGSGKVGLSLPARIWLMVGSSAALWAAILAGARTLVA